MAEPMAPRQFDLTPSDLPKSLEVQALQATLQEALSRAGYWEDRHLVVECDGDVITISGRVPTYYLKQLVQNIALSAPGVGIIRNDLHVC